SGAVPTRRVEDVRPPRRREGVRPGKDDHYVYIVAHCQRGFSEGASGLVAALDKARCDDELVFDGMPDLYHWDVRLHTSRDYRMLEYIHEPTPVIAAVVFLNLAMPPADLLDVIRFVRDFLPIAVFVLYADSDELERCRREAPEELARRLPFFYILLK